MRIFSAVLVLMLCSPALAELAFVLTPQPGAQEAVDNWYANVGAPDWPWGVAAIEGAVALQEHSSRGGIVIARNQDGSWSDVTPLDENGERWWRGGVPSENRPYVFDTNNDGFLDFLHSGDESPNSPSLLNNGDGTFTPSMDHRIADGYGVVKDFNSDGFLDVRIPRKFSGVLKQRTMLNSAGQGFTSDPPNTPWNEILPWPRPAGLPQEVADRLDALEGVGGDNSAAGPLYWEGDLDGVNGDDVIVSYWKSYPKSAYTWSAICLRQPDGTLALANSGFNDTNAIILPPFDAEGDGDLDFIAQWGADPQGLYIQTSPGVFEYTEEGGAREIARYCGWGPKPPYIYECWSEDLDLDGDPDMILGMKRHRRSLVLENDNGVWREHELIWHGDGQPIDVGDVDGDGDKDIVTFTQGGEVQFRINQAISGPPPVDTTPPTITVVAPPDGATDVPPEVAPTLTFSEAMDPATVTANEVKLLLSGQEVTSAVGYDQATRTATITPPAPLDESTTYTVSCAGVTDLAGNLLEQAFSSTFTVADPPPPPAPQELIADQVAIVSQALTTITTAADAEDWPAVDAAVAQAQAALVEVADVSEGEQSPDP